MDFFKKLIENIVEEELEEINAIGTGAVVGYNLPVGMKPDYSKFGINNQKKKRKKQWYDIDKFGSAENNVNIEEEFIGKEGGVRYFQMGASLPDELYNRTKEGKSTRDPGIAGVNKKRKKK